MRIFFSDAPSIIEYEILHTSTAGGACCDQTFKRTSGFREYETMVQTARRLYKISLKAQLTHVRDVPVHSKTLQTKSELDSASPL